MKKKLFLLCLVMIVIVRSLNAAHLKVEPIADVTEMESIQEKEVEEELVYVVVENMPEFVGGQSAMLKYIDQNLHYPVAAQRNGIQGRVICQFVVNKDGSISDIEVVRSVGDMSLDNEAIRIIASMPHWIPGKQHGEVIRVKYTLPINFCL